MHKICEYREHAEECLAMARRAADEGHKRQLLDIADAWVMLAEARETQLANQAKLSIFLPRRSDTQRAGS